MTLSRQAQAARRERLRQRTVWLCLLFVVLLPLEGIIRKWIFSSFHQPFLFIRDPVAIAIFVYYLLYRAPRVPPWAIYWLFGVIVAIGVTMIQVITRDVPLIVVMLGLRNYFLFVPMALVMGDIFRIDDLKRLVVLFCYLAIPTAVLVMAQFFSPVSAWVNKGISDDADAKVFEVVAGIVRPYGPFTFVIGQTTFTSLMLAVVVAGWDRHRQWGIPLGLLGAALLSVFIMGALSGSRTFFLSGGIITASYLIGGLLTRDVNKGLMRAAAAAMGAVVFLVLLIFVFPTSFEAITERQETAVLAEGQTSGRVVDMLSPVPVTGPGLSPFGEGLGAGSNAGTFASTGSRDFVLSEYEMPRLFQESGILLGGAFLIFRLLMVAVGMNRAFRNAQRFSSAAGFAMLGFVAPTFFLIQMSGQNQAISIGWLAVGIMLAMTRADVQIRAKRVRPTLGR